MARDDRSKNGKGRRAPSRAPVGLGETPRISDVVSFTIALPISYGLLAYGVCVQPWCSGGVIDTATALTALIGSTLSLVWRGLRRIVGGGRGPGGKRGIRRRRKRPVPSVVPKVPDIEGNVAAARGVEPVNFPASAGVEPGTARGTSGTRAVREAEPAPVAPTMWPDRLLETAGRAHDAD